MRRVISSLLMVLIFCVMSMGGTHAQIIDIETFGTGSYPGPELPAGQTNQVYNPVAQPANPTSGFLQDGEYVIATNAQEGFTNWADVGDNTTGTGYMMLVNADANAGGEFYRRSVPLTANTSFDFVTHAINVNSQGDFVFCSGEPEGYIEPNIRLQIEAPDGTVLASTDTGNIPFDPTPEWQPFELVFATNASTTSVDVVLFNNSPGGCGNDLAVDDIIFRVAITMEASDDDLTITDTTTQQNDILFVGANDTLNGNPLLGTELYFIEPPSALPPELLFDTDTGGVSVLAGTPNGDYSFEYRVCETANEFNCDTAIVTTTVNDPSVPPAAPAVCPAGTSQTFGTFHVDSITGGNNSNDALGAPLPEGTQAEVNGTPVASGNARAFGQSVTYDLTGDLDLFAPEGEIIDLSFAMFFGNNPEINIEASLDGSSFTSIGSTGDGSSFGSLLNTFRYDAFIVPSGGARFIRLSRIGFNGGYRFDGAIFSSLCTPTPDVSVEAEDDNGTVSDSSLGDTPVLNVLDNDSIDGVSPPANFDLSLPVGETLPTGLTFDTATGAVTVLQGTPTGILSFDYTLCEAGNDLNCETVTVTINVTNPNPPSICPFGASPITGTFHAVSVQSNTQFQTLNNPNNALGAPLPDMTPVTDNDTGVSFNASVLYDLTGDPDILVPEGTVIDVAISNRFGSNPNSDISTSLDGTSFTVVGTSTGPWPNNILRYDQYTVPAGGTRFLEIEFTGQAFRFDGVIYDTQCVAGAPEPDPEPDVSVVKTVAMFDPAEYAIPGNDIVYTITVTNSGDGVVDNDTLELIDIMPSEVAFFNSSLDPVVFIDTGSGLTFDSAVDVAFSDTATAPADFSACNYVPITDDYDPAVTFICFNPKGTMNAMSEWSVSFRARIE